MMDLQSTIEEDASAYPKTFPQSFVQYCRSNGIPPSIFQQIPWNELRSLRFIRVRSRTGVPEELRELAQRVPWLPCNAYRIPRSLTLSSCAAYRSSDICCMDAASMASVVALQVRAGDRVLDLCCCPGMKLLLIADALREAAAAVAGSATTSPSGDSSSGKQQPLGQVVGVDVSVDRLFVARSIVRKYRCDDLVSLVCCDGRDYDPFHMARVAATQSMHPTDVDRRVRQVKRYVDRRAKRQRNGNDTGGDIPTRNDTVAAWMLFSEQEALLCNAIHNDQLGVVPPLRSAETSNVHASALAAGLLFDKILVDVECTHDGSVYHLDFNHDSETNENPVVLSAAAAEGPSSPPPSGGGRSDGVGAGGITNARRMEKMHVGEQMEGSKEYSTESIDTLHALQLALLHRAFALLAPGGTIVYSTCSFSEGQNEAIVVRFLNDIHNNASKLLCVPVVPFGLEQEHHPPAPAAASSPTTMTMKCDGVSPLLRMCDDDVRSALRDVVDLSRRTWNVELGSSDGSLHRESHAIPLVTARFWPNRSLTSFQFVAVLKKV